MINIASVSKYIKKALHWLDGSDGWYWSIQYFHRILWPLVINAVSSTGGYARKFASSIHGREARILGLK